MPATFSSPHLLFFSTLLCILSSSSSVPPLLSSSHLSLHSPPISVLASLVSSCPAHVTLPLSSLVFHRPSFLRVQPTVICSSPVSLSSSTALPSLPLTPPFFACLLSLLLLFFGCIIFNDCRSVVDASFILGPLWQFRCNRRDIDENIRSAEGGQGGCLLPDCICFTRLQRYRTQVGEPPATIHIR